MEVSVLIMAGGKGERFWPESRRAHPKQFLALNGEKVMLQKTAARVVPALVDYHHLYVITEATYLPLVQQYLPDIPEANILVEPVGRNTAACIGWAADQMAEKWGGASIMVVLPADHEIGKEAEFITAVKAAAAWAQGGDLTMLGIKPDRAETGFGYIEQGAELGERYGMKCYRAARFVEKPVAAVAEEYLQSGRYFWNSGMFVWRVDAIRSAIAACLPELASRLSEIKPILVDGGASLAQVYPRLPAISIDYGVLEKVKNTAVLPCDLQWNDVGSWSSLTGLLAADEEGNVATGQHVAVRTSNCIIVNRTSDLVATLGMKDCIVVATNGVTLVCPRAEAQNVREIVAELQRLGLEQCI